MSTSQDIAHVAPGFRKGYRTVLMAVGVLVAAVITVTILALAGAHQSTVARPATSSQPAFASTPHMRYLGPRQQRALIAEGAAAATVGAGVGVAHYVCLGSAQRCLR